jgi:hypothetical protein
MTLTSTTIGHVLLHIYDFSPGATIYLPDVRRYEADTPCIVAEPTTFTQAEEALLHQTCLTSGYKNWLNVAVVSDTCDDASEQTAPCLIAAFNEDCQEGGWLWRMMNYRNPDASLEQP